MPESEPEGPSEPEVTPAAPLETVLVVSAHPDDPEFAAGATVAKLAAGGARVFYCVCTDGSQGGEDPDVPDHELTERRYAEQRAAAAVLGVAEVTFLGLKDGHLAAGLDLRRAITAEIRRRRPDLVITHNPMRSLSTGIGASHPDHLAVGEATLCAVYPDARNPRAFRDLLEQGLEPHRVREVWVSAYDQADHFIEVSRELLELKIKAIGCHASQFEKPGTDVENGPRQWITDRMKQLGERAGFEFAEGFKRIETA